MPIIALTADAAPEPVWGDGERAHLGQVVPQHVQGTAADDVARPLLRHDELLQALVVGDGVLVDEHPAGGQRRDQRTDRRDVAGAGGADVVGPGVGASHRVIIAGLHRRDAGVAGTPSQGCRPRRVERWSYSVPATSTGGASGSAVFGVPLKTNSRSLPSPVASTSTIEPALRSP